MKKHIEQESSRVNNDNAEGTLRTGHLVRPDGTINTGKKKRISEIAARVVAQGMKDESDRGRKEPLRVEIRDNGTYPLFYLVNEAGQTIEDEFQTENEAKEWAKEQGHLIVYTFFVGKAQHTAGPWSLTDGIYIDSDTDKEVATNVVELRHGRTISENEAQANARLIAAAPELLGALKFLLSEAESRFDYVDVTEDEVEALAKAKAAIAKATEGQTK